MGVLGFWGYCFSLDLPHHLNDKVLEGRLVVGPADELVVHQPLLLTDGSDHRDRVASQARHLQHHFSANRGLSWYQPVVEGTFIHIDDLLAFLDQLSHLEGHQLLVLCNLQLHYLLAAILVLRLAACDLVPALEVAQGCVVDIHSEPLLYLE